MILLLGKNQMANVLHVLLGEETDFWTQLHGAAAVDITPILQQMEQGKPIVLHVTRCDSEHQVAHHIQGMMGAGGHYPFVPPTFVFTPKSAPDAVQQATAPVSPGPYAAAADSQAQGIIGRCSRCLIEGAVLVPSLSPQICHSCATIDLTMARKNFKVVPPTRARKAGETSAGG